MSTHPTRRSLALLVAAATALVYLLAVWTPAGLALDAAGLEFGTADHPGLSEKVAGVLGALSTPAIAVATVALVVIALRARRLALTARAALAGVLAVATAEVLKVTLPGRAGDPAAPLSSPLQLLDPAWWAQVHAGPVVLSGSFPSGHSAIATALVLALLTAVPSKLSERLAAPLVALAAVASAATVVATWHRPSDALAGMLVAAGWWLALVPAAGRERAAASTRRARTVVRRPRRALVPVRA